MNRLQQSGIVVQLMKIRSGVMNKSGRGMRGEGRRGYSSSVGKRVLGIRREDYTGVVWERRAPLSPQHVRDLVRDGVKVLVQPSTSRAFYEEEYVDAGAVIQEDLSKADLIMGVKQVPVTSLIADKTYSFFSHTIKAQPENMPLLDKMIENNVRMIDYEKMLDSRGLRVAAFGKYAGISGMFNILHGVGLRLMALGHGSPFLSLSAPQHYRDLSAGLAAVRDVGYQISLGRLSNNIAPLTFVFTGTGNVSQGAQEVFNELPHEYVKPWELEEVSRTGDHRKLYGTVVGPEHHCTHKHNKPFVLKEFFANPIQYESDFSTKIAPFMSVLVNCIYWAVGAPRLLSTSDLSTLLSEGEGGHEKITPHQLLAIADISADKNGAIEFMDHCTTIDKPYIMYDSTGRRHDDIYGNGVLLCSIDNMPAQIPRESSDFFGSCLLPFVPEMLKSDAAQPLDQEQFTPEIHNAIITSNGALTPDYEYIKELSQKMTTSVTGSSVARRKVLLLGAGYVAAPCVDYITKHPDVQLTVASAIESEAVNLATKFPNTTPTTVDIMNNKEELEKLIRDHDVVISLLPYVLHPEVATLCVKNKRHLVTSSYVSPTMLSLDTAAKEAGISLVNECGVDPGIDHLLAMECIHDVQDRGGEITSFESWCGGLPAPEFSDNPLRYKFSWSPKGVLLNCTNMARYLLNGEIVEIGEGGALLEHAQSVDVYPGFNLEGFPNRDSTEYTDLYGIGTARTVLRGTLRYSGYSDAMKGILRAGYLSSDEHSQLHPGSQPLTWREFVADLLMCNRGTTLDGLKDVLLSTTGSQDRVSAIEGLGLLSEDCVPLMSTPIDALSTYLASKYSVLQGESDVLIMKHSVGIKWPNNKEELHEIGLVVYGDPQGYSAMAKTVGSPTAIAAMMVLNGEIRATGSVLPLTADIYNPMLKSLAGLGIHGRTTIKTL